MHALGTQPATRSTTLDVLLKHLASSALRDLEPDTEMIGALLALVPLVWDEFELEDQCKWHTLLAGMLRLPEFVAAAPHASSHLSAEWLRPHH